MLGLGRDPARIGGETKKGTATELKAVRAYRVARTLSLEQALGEPRRPEPRDPVEGKTQRACRPGRERALAL